MNESLRQRLQQLGVVKGARHLATPAPRPTPSVWLDEAASCDLTSLLPEGQVIETQVGAYFCVDHVYPWRRPHGAVHLGDLAGWSLAVLSGLSEPRLPELTATDLIFLDTETTGLAGSGALAFMVGVAFFDGPALVTRQYFLRDQADEAAMLTALADLMATRRGLATFNGALFDVPLLRGRYLMNRLTETWSDRPHLDLLPLARRLWRRRLGSVALSALEGTVLGVQRSQADVPGWAIPALYYDYLRTGDAREMARVFYHNEVDLLSMITLATISLRLVSAPQTWPHGEDVASLAGWRWQAGEVESAESLFHLAAACEHDSLAAWQASLMQLAALLKQQGRRAEAALFWQQVAATTQTDIRAHVELAKYYEWHTGDLRAALSCTQAALRLAERHPAAMDERSALLHRLARLERKCDTPFVTAPEWAED